MHFSIYFLTIKGKNIVKNTLMIRLSWYMFKEHFKCFIFGFCETNICDLNVFGIHKVILFCWDILCTDIAIFGRRSKVYNL